MVILRESSVSVQKGITWKGSVNRPELDGQYGLAVDIGTTTVVVGLYDLASGTCMASVSERNKQCQLGRDVMMRLMHAQNGREQELHDMIVRQIEDLAIRLCSEVCKLSQLSKICLVGNTVMCHFFLKMDTKRLAGVPFHPAYEGSFSGSSEEIGFQSITNCQIYVLPGIAAHVGADAMAVYAVEEMGISSKTILAVDIGTNAEMLLHCSGGDYACSAAAGPAFEGREVSCGMPAGDGVISAVQVGRGSGNIILDFIAAPVRDAAEQKLGAGKNQSLGAQGKGRKIKGICGSGLVDLIAELRRNHVLTEDGYLLECEEAKESGVLASMARNLFVRDGERCFQIYPERNSMQQCQDGEEVYISQSDIRSIQLAKAAIQAGICCLLKEAGCSIAEVDMVLFAGMFGSQLPVSSAIAFGLFPDISREKIKVVGNAAGSGAVTALFDDTFREMAERQAKKIVHVELAQREDFQKEFMIAMSLRPWIGGTGE